MNNKPLILITNDDGYEAEGIRELTRGLRTLGELVVVAPDSPRSGMSAAITAAIPISFTLRCREEGLTIYSCTGTPADCVKLAVNELLDRRPALLASGINHGGNQALSVHYSGTMGAAMEGCVFDIPSVGISLAHYVDGAPFAEAVRIGRRVCEAVLKHGLPHGIYLNLNVPNVPQVQGIAVCRQADGKWVDEYVQMEGSDGTRRFQLGGEFVCHEPAHPDNDVQRLNEGFASLVPCLLDVTDHSFTTTLQRWNL